MFKRLITVPAMLMALTGCASQQEKLNEWAQANGAKTEVIQTSNFPIQVLTPAHFSPGKRLTIYIEGDGHAWATRSQPSLDPTPRALTVAELATKSHPGIYVARPCQFVMSHGCNKSIWTDARFSHSAVESVNTTITKLKDRYKASELELIGYSGGAAVAVLIASERDDVTQLQTVAGNVDPAAWVTLNGLSALTGSMNTLSRPEKLSAIPQRHYVGTNDKVIPKSLIDGFVGKISARCAEVVEVAGDHASVLSHLTGSALNKLITCRYP